MVILQVVAAVLLMFGSLLVLRAVSQADLEVRPSRSPRPRLRAVRSTVSKPRKARTPRPAADLPRAA